MCSRSREPITKQVHNSTPSWYGEIMREWEEYSVLERISTCSRCSSWKLISTPVPFIAEAKPLATSQRQTSDNMKLQRKQNDHPGCCCT